MDQIKTIEIVHKLMKLQGPVILDTGFININKNTMPIIYITIGQQGGPISIVDVLHAFKKCKTLNKHNNGVYQNPLTIRSLIKVKGQKNIYKIKWL